MDDFIDTQEELGREAIDLSQKAATEQKRQFFGALIMSDGIYDIYLLAVKQHRSNRDLKRPCFIAAKDFASEED